MTNSLPNDPQHRLGPLGDGCAPSEAEAEASAAVDAVEAQSAEQPAVAGEQVTDIQPPSERRVRHDKRSQKRREIRADLQFMVAANRQAGGQGVYAGFRFVRTGIEVAPDEEPYLGTFLPLNVALKNTNLMAFTSLAYEDVFINEEIAPGTRMVVGLGQFRPYRSGSLVSQLTSPGAILAYALLAAAALAGLAVWFNG
jgi:hypothetical protein